MELGTIYNLDLLMVIPLFLVGSLLHFVYDFSKHHKTLAFFGAVNESYWEHLKIAFWPVFLLYLIEFVLGGYKFLSFIPSKTIALYSILISIISFVYGYKFITKKNILFLDIFIFFLGIVLAQFIGATLLAHLDLNIWIVIVSIVFLTVLLIGFIRFTYKPPKDLDIFKDPTTNKYGIKGHKTRS